MSPFTLLSSPILNAVQADLDLDLGIMLTFSSPCTVGL